MRSRASLIRYPLQAALCGLALVAVGAPARAGSEEPAHSAELDAAIIRQAQRNGVPEKLVRRIVMRESRYNPRARNHSFWGLMQISYPTAKSMGFKGTPQDLLNPIINLRYAVPYLANAFIIAGKREDAAVRLYASGYYSTAKQRGLLGILRTAETAPVSGEPDETMVAAAVPPPESNSVFGSLFGALPAPEPALQTASYKATDSTPSPTAALAQGTNATDAGVDLSVDKPGGLQIPKKWLRDGGTSRVARGEQGIEQVAAYEKSTAETPPSRGRASHKKTNFAALDQPPASAQAYAATADGQDLRATHAESQAAIQQVTSGQPGSVGQSDPQGVATTDQGASQSTTSKTRAEEKPLKRTRTALKAHARGADKKLDGNPATDAAVLAKTDVVASAHHKHAATKAAVNAAPAVPPATQAIAQQNEP